MIIVNGLFFGFGRLKKISDQCGNPSYAHSFFLSRREEIEVDLKDSQAA
jgi:hypothetical protein